MRQTMPTVKRGRLYQVERENVPIDVGTPSWYNWLEEHTSFLFVDHMCAVNVRKYRVDHAEPEWKASRTRLGKVFTVSLGPSHALTFSNLRAAARRLAGKHTHNRSISLSVENPSTSRLPVAEPVTINGSMSSFMRTKLYRPRNSSDTIPRPRLIESLNVALGSEITLVCAPAGFGKSTLVIQWLQTNDRPNVWLSLDKQDNNLPIFLQSLATALQTTFPDAFEATASLLMSPRILPPDQIVALLINDLADMSEDFILVLDDYHFIHNQKVHTIIELLIEHLPPQLHLVLICRSDPPLPIIKWLTKGRLTELRGTDLRFTLEETEAFLTRLLGSEAALETASVLDERTEGWIAALRLAALSLRGTSDRAAFMERLDSYAANSISSYLVEEVLSQQTQEMQRLLECTSILEQFCAESCAAVMGNEISPEQVQATLGEMEHENLFLVVLDRHRGWYRFHHLFQELLQQRLQTHCSKEELVILHRQASEWYASQNLIEEAIRHALLAGDESTAGQLVETHFFQVFEREQLVLMEHRLQLLTEEQVHESPFLLVAQAWISQARGQLRELPRLLTSASQLLASREQYMNDTQNSSFRLLHALIATFWSLYHFFDGQPQKSLESAHTALALLQPTEKFIASHALELLAWSLQATGFEKGALASLQEVLLSQPSSMSTTARLLFSQTYVYLAMGKLPHAEQTARHLLQIALKAELAISRNYAHWLLGLVHYEQNQLDEAAYHFSAVIADQQQAH
ncbi:MAG TPA: hypothetical protein VEI53_12030, partial [Ktedonobacteraceae bacterium]|nr:hypothetical protein [Ktedonobacteraceae bacterium]